jgi:hypothetical protein
MLTRNQRKALSRQVSRDLPWCERLFSAIDGGRSIGSLLLRMFTVRKSILECDAHEPLPLKDARLRQLLDAGFNIAHFRSWLRQKLDLTQLRELFEKYPSLSLRTFSEEWNNEPPPRLPVLYDQRQWEKIKEFCSINNRSYHTLVNECIPLADSEYCGNIILMKDYYVAVFFNGSGTPRYIDDEIAENTLSASVSVLQNRYGAEIPAWAPESLGDIIDRLRTFLFVRRPVAVEFSKYPYPVGILRTNTVYWEWRGGALSDVEALKEYLMRTECFQISAHLNAGGKHASKQ